MATTQTFTFPTSRELMEIERELLPTLTQDDPIFDEFPIREIRAVRVSWEQRDNYRGLQQVRGINGAPGHVVRPGANRYDYEPGVYGEFTTIDEKELTERRRYGTFGDPINISDLVGESQELLLTRRLDRIRQISWTLATTGTFSVANGRGQVLHTDVFNLQTFSAAVPWGTFATATPFADLLAMSLKYRGKSVDFGKGATLYMNRTKLNQLLQNTNASDAFGRRLPSGATFNSIDDLNSWFQANDLPQVKGYDGGYIDDSGTFQLFIPDNKAVLFGRRTNNAKLGEYLMTINANNPNLEPGAYTRVIDHGEDSVPRRIDVHDGHNGGPVIYYPSAIVVMTV
jgi:hypothetical protein